MGVPPLPWTHLTPAFADWRDGGAEPTVRPRLAVRAPAAVTRKLVPTLSWTRCPRVGRGRAQPFPLQRLCPDARVLVAGAPGRPGTPCRGDSPCCQGPSLLLAPAPHLWTPPVEGRKTTREARHGLGIPETSQLKYISKLRLGVLETDLPPPPQPRERGLRLPSTPLERQDLCALRGKTLSPPAGEERLYFS